MRHKIAALSFITLPLIIWEGTNSLAGSRNFLMQVPAFFLSNSNGRFSGDSNSLIEGDGNLLNHNLQISINQ